MSLIVMVEIPRGSRNKYEYNRDDKRFYLDRMLFGPLPVGLWFYP